MDKVPVAQLVGEQPTDLSRVGLFDSEPRTPAFMKRLSASGQRVSRLEPSIMTMGR